MLGKELLPDLSVPVYQAAYVIVWSPTRATDAANLPKLVSPVLWEWRNRSASLEQSPVGMSRECHQRLCTIPKVTYGALQRHVR